MTKPRLMDTSFLRGRVAKRIFLLFVASALVPIIMLAALYQFQGSALLLKHAQGRLRGTSATYSTAIYDRLVLADQALRGVAAEIGNDTEIAELLSAVDAMFASLERLPYRHGELTPHDRPSRLGLLAPHIRKQLLDGDTALLTKAGSDNQPEVFFARLADPARPEKGTILARLRNQYLWAERDSNPYLTELCVLDQKFEPLSCTQAFALPGLSAALQREAAKISGDLEWKDEAQPYVGHFREVFLEAKFTVPRWIVVASQRRSDALGSLEAFRTMFWASLGMSLLMALLLTSVQIRRTMVPLEKLIQGTGKLGSRDFSAQVEIASNDEFGELANSFNAMAKRLGKQFDVMTALSAIDRAILYELDIDRLMEELLLSLRIMYGLECAGIVVVDRDKHDRTRLYSIGSENNAPMTKHSHAGTDIHDVLLANTDGYWATPEEMGWRGMTCKAESKAQHLFNLPFGSKSGPSGQLMLGFEGRIELNEDDIGYIREFADRIGVALSSAARDEQLFRQARYDGLTGLPNRFLLIERLKQAVAEAQRSDKSFAVLYVDLDRFKQINDSLGHAAGDLLLQEAAQRLRDCVRGSDTVARVGGDEFTILLGGFSDASIARTVAQHILTAMEKSFMLSGTENFVSASIGVAIYPHDGTDPGQLLRNADTSMYRAKASGRARFVFFEDDMNAEVVRIAKLDRELRHALSKQQLLLHYQPQIDLRTGAMCAVEALVRWEHPQRGVLKPGHFIDFAEDSGLIVALGEFVLQEACRQYSRWRDLGIGINRIAVNVSGRQFRQPGFTELVENVLRETGIPGSALSMEITENVLIEDVAVVIPILSRLKSLGIRIALDDFGTGFSSMSYLERLPIDTLKIDRAFIATIDSAGRGGVIAKLVLDMARSLDMSVVAEGLERLEHLKFLCDHDCDVGQGYLFSRPLPPDALTEFLATWNLVTRKEFFARAGSLAAPPISTAS
ncbi:MAG: EAL domain-containing protein [Betaproteobacteria bacterium]|nr:MAG: EAL domain-containing protein [Betaproteobacteria bacterium]